MKRLQRLFFSGTVFLLFLLNHPLYAQISYFNSDDYWHRFSLKAQDYPLQIHENDTAVIIATNRVFDDTALRFLPDKYHGGIRYFIIYSREGKWNVIPVSSLKEAVNALPGTDKDWVIYTEGMGKLFTTSADRAMRMNAEYGVNVIYLDYPSINAKWRRTRNYYFAKHNASIAYKDLAPVFDTIKMLKQQHLLGPKSVNLFFHSMGNIVLQKMVQNKKIGFMNTAEWVDNLILNAACVPQRKHREWLAKIKFAKRIYVLYNPNDFTLGGAYFMTKKNQLGMKVKKPVYADALYVNFEKLVGKRHSNFLNLYGYSPQPDAAMQFYKVLFHGGKANLDDTVHFRISSYRHIGWDILP